MAHTLAIVMGIMPSEGQPTITYNAERHCGAIYAYVSQLNTYALGLHSVTRFITISFTALFMAACYNQAVCC